MKHTLFIAGILIFFGLTILTTGVLNTVLFGFFWLFVLGTLMSLIATKRWDGGDWLVFATFAASTIVGVLYAAKSFTDLVAIAIPLLGLLLVTLFVSAMPKKRMSTPVQKKETKKKKVKVLFVAPKTGKKYHRLNCRLLKTKNLEMYDSKAAAQAAGLTPCKVCLGE